MSTYLLLQSDLEHASVKMIKTILTKIPTLKEITEEGGERQKITQLLEEFLVSHYTSEELILALLDKGVKIHSEIVQKILAQESASLGVIAPYIPSSLLNEYSEIPSFTSILSNNLAFLGKGVNDAFGHNTQRWKVLNNFRGNKVSFDLYKTQLAESVHSLNQFELEDIFGKIIHQYAKYPNLLKEYPLKDMLLAFGKKDEARPKVDLPVFVSNKRDYRTPVYQMIQVLFNQGASFYAFAQTLIIEVLFSIPYAKESPLARQLLSAVYHSSREDPSLSPLLGEIYRQIAQRRTWMFSLGDKSSELQTFLFDEKKGQKDVVYRFLLASVNGHAIELFKNIYTTMRRHSSLRPNDSLLQLLLSQAASKGNILVLEEVFNMLKSDNLIEQSHLIQAWKMAVSEGKIRAAKRLLREIQIDSDSVPQMLSCLSDGVHSYSKPLRSMISLMLEQFGYEAVSFTNNDTYRANLAISILKGPLPNRHCIAELLRIDFARNKFKAAHQEFIKQTEDAKSFYQLYVMSILDYKPVEGNGNPILSLIQNELRDELVERIHSDLVQDIAEENSQAVMVSCFMDAIQNEEALKVLYTHYYLAADLDDGLDVFMDYIQKIALSESFSSLISDININDDNAMSLLYDSSFYKSVIEKQMALISKETIDYLDELFVHSLKRCGSANECAKFYDAISLTESTLSTMNDEELLDIRQRYMNAFLGLEAKNSILDKFPLLQATPFLLDLTRLYIDYKFIDLSYASFNHYLKLTYIEMDREEAVHPYPIHSIETYLNRFDADFAFEVAYENDIKHILYNVINAALSKTNDFKINVVSSRFMIELVDRLYSETDDASLFKSDLSSKRYTYGTMTPPNEGLSKQFLSAVYHHGVDEPLLVESLMSVGLDYPHYQAQVTDLTDKVSAMVSVINNAFETERKIIAYECSAKPNSWSPVFLTWLFASVTFCDRMALSHDPELESSNSTLRISLITFFSAVAFSMLQRMLNAFSLISSSQKKEPSCLLAREAICDRESPIHQEDNQGSDEADLRAIVSDVIDGFIVSLEAKNQKMVEQGESIHSDESIQSEDSDKDQLSDEGRQISLKKLNKQLG